MAAAARLCRLLPTGRKNVVASLVVHFRLHVLEAQVVSVGVPATIHRRIQLAKHSQVRSALPLAARLCRLPKQECRGLKERQLRLLSLDAPLSLVEVFFRQLEADVFLSIPTITTILL